MQFLIITLQGSNREIYYEEMAHVIMEAKSHSPLSAS